MKPSVHSLGRWRPLEVTNDMQGSSLDIEIKFGFSFPVDLMPLELHTRGSFSPLPRVAKRTVGESWQLECSSCPRLPDLPCFLVFYCFHAFLRAMFPTESKQNEDHCAMGLILFSLDDEADSVAVVATSLFAA